MARHITAQEVHEAFIDLFEALLDPQFSKSHQFKHWSERELLPSIRMFLLGRFGNIVLPEEYAQLPGNESGSGRLDFVIGRTAVEVAVRRTRDKRSKLSSSSNLTEIKKLMKHDGRAVLVLLDFSKDPLSKEHLDDQYRGYISMGKGPHKRSPYVISYHGRRDAHHKRHIRV